MQNDRKPPSRSQSLQDSGSAMGAGTGSSKRKLPDWMSSANKQPVFKKKMKSNSLFR